MHVVVFVRVEEGTSIPLYRDKFFLKAYCAAQLRFQYASNLDVHYYAQY